ncbi:MAG: spore cortex biosynthesis protein YabQ [Clostridia bacterium]|nr:spore cortex biosynthesis protein YabQ [Clostridia bacterium]
METYISQQAMAFLWSAVLGAALGVLYDWFRIGRILKKKWWLTVFLEDLLFSLLAAIATAFCFTLTNYGQVRLFLLVGEGLGFIIYFNTIGVLVVKQARLFARFLAFLRRQFCQIFRFFGRNIRKIMNFFKKPFIFFKRWYTMKMYHLKERNAAVEKRSKSNSKGRKGKKGKADESRGAGSSGGCSDLRCRKHAGKLRKASGSDPRKKGRTQRRAAKDLHPDRHQ